MIKSARANLEEAARTLGAYASKIEADPARLDEIDNRLQEVTRLKRKIGGSIDSALETLERSRAEIGELEGIGESKAQVEAAISGGTRRTRRARKQTFLDSQARRRRSQPQDGSRIEVARNALSWFRTAVRCARLRGCRLRTWRRCTKVRSASTQWNFSCRRTSGSRLCLWRESRRAGNCRA